MEESKTTNNGKYSFCPLRKLKKSILATLFCFPTSVFAILLLLLLSYNGASIFCIKVPSFPPPKHTSTEKLFSLENKFSVENRRISIKRNEYAMLAVKEEYPNFVMKEKENLFSGEIILRKVKPVVEVSEVGIKMPPLQNLQKENLFSGVNDNRRKQVRSSGNGGGNVMMDLVGESLESKLFSRKVKEFLNRRSSSSENLEKCKVRFFMTWISSVESFINREFFTIESVFKSHPNACLVILSSSLDSIRGNEVLEPFISEGFRVLAISPDFDYLFKNTYAERWFYRLKKGEVNPGDVSLGQNLSNLVRLSVLYKFGGIYLDTDVIVLKKFTGLRNVIGAQTMDLKTGNWSRLNNAVMIFDKKHPLLFKFIQEFALTFNGNKWGHNGPYLVSRVVSRVVGKPDFNFTILPPQAFYPVDWSRIQSLFHAPRAGMHSKWMTSKLARIRKESFAVHLWNKHSRNLTIEGGSIISKMMLDCCIFCNSSVSATYS